jgi:hypothetical protein
MPKAGRELLVRRSVDAANRLAQDLTRHCWLGDKSDARLKNTYRDVVSGLCPMLSLHAPCQKISIQGRHPQRVLVILG